MQRFISAASFCLFAGFHLFETVSASVGGSLYGSGLPTHSGHGLGAALPISLLSSGAGDRVFIDSDGRERIFHGVNSVVKGPPWVPETRYFHVNYSMTEHDMQILSSMGMNVIRLGVMWAGVEPVQGQYNTSYLQQLELIVNWGAQYGVYSLFDMHQDVLADQFCGEGLPLWAVEAHIHPIFDFPAPLAPKFNSTEYENSTGYNLPTKSACYQNSWAGYQASAAANVAYEALYTDSQLLTAWSNMWTYVTKYFKGNPAVLGLELINEPWVGNAFADPLLMIPGVADKERLQPAYEVLQKSIRQEDAERLIFFAGVTWDDFGAGFTQAPGGPEWSNTSVFAFHYYEPPQFKNSSQFDFKLHIRDAERLGTGRMLTEFGAPSYNPTYDVDAGSADSHLLSWILWEFKSYCQEDAQSSSWPSQWGKFGACRTGYGGVTWDESSGQPDKDSYTHIARTYPTAVAGKIHSFTFDHTNSSFSLSYSLSLSCAMPTEIYVDETFHYPNGLQVQVQPSDTMQAKWTAGTFRVYVTPLAGAQSGQTINVKIIAN